MTEAASLTVDLAGRLGQFSLRTRFAAPPSGVTALFGPSGCGKTTVLRCIAGLEHLPGRIDVHGECWQDSERGHFLPAHQRHVGYVFQEASLFDHLDVRANLLYGARRVPGAQPRAITFDDVVSLLGIGHLLDRSPHALSGGERQRVAVGRALLSSPRVLLMDEPLSALDRATKDDILPYFEKLHESLALPIVYVSHDYGEVERLADTLVLMREGAVVAAGPLSDLQTNPDLPLLALPEATVMLPARVARIDTSFDLTELDVSGGTVVVPGCHGAVGDRRRVRIAAADVSLALTAPKDSTILNALAATIVAIGPARSTAQLNVIVALGADGGGERIVARVTRKSSAALGLTVGARVFAQIKSVALVAGRG